jgi:broad specificity phosphatase PhoE
VINLDREVLTQRGEFERILVHELFHFVWVRLSNQVRREWEGVLAAEFRARAPGELGWSAEWRKAKLSEADSRARPWAWRRYACESFCDSAARFYSGLEKHGEFTLAARWTRRRSAWMTNLATNGLRL